MQGHAWRPKLKQENVKCVHFMVRHLKKKASDFYEMQLQEDQKKFWSRFSSSRQRVRLHFSSLRFDFRMEALVLQAPFLLVALDANEKK